MKLASFPAVILMIAALTGCSDKPLSGTLRVCLGEADPPRSEKPGIGFDVDVARLLAEQLGRNLEFVWLPESNLRQIESSDLDFTQLLQGACDMQLSIPGVEAIARHREQLVLSSPYYGTSFELIPEDAELNTPGRLAVRANTVAHVFIDSLGIQWTMQPDSASIVKALESGKADVGLIWGPDLALVDTVRNEEFLAPPILRWNQHATFRAGDDALRAEIDTALHVLRGNIFSLFDEHGIPPHAPFADIHNRSQLRAL